MPSARPSSRRPRPGAGGRLAAVLLCASLLAGSAVGCSTTQEKAAKAQARAQHILAARAKRRHHKHHDGPKSQNHPADGTKSPTGSDKSARRPGGLDFSAHGGKETR